MEPDLIEYLDRRFDESREELREFRLETSKHFDESREDLQKLRLETSKRFDESRAETSKLFDDSRVDTSTTFEELRTEIRLTHVLLEDQSSRLQTVAEGVASNDQKITRLRTEMNGQFEDLKGLLYPSIQDLGRRVTDLEAR